MKTGVLLTFFTIILSGVYADDNPYPRLAMWWLDAEKESAKKIARYDLLLNEFEFEKGERKIAAVREKNPSIRIFRPISPTEMNWYVDGGVNPVMEFLPSAFFLLNVGSVLSEEIDTTAAEIHVERMLDADGNELFHKGRTVAIGEKESALIVSIDAKRKVLNVKRGFVRGAVAHPKGTRINEHVTFWSETWVMNNTVNCERVRLQGFAEKMNWLETYFTLLTMEAHPFLSENYLYIDQENLSYDGMLIDRFEDHQSWLGTRVRGDLISLDLRHDNNPVSAETFDRSWINGTDVLLNLLRKNYPGLPVIRNNSQSVRFEKYDGQVFETGGWSEPDTGWWERLIIEGGPVPDYPTASYLDWFERGGEQVYVVIEVYEDESMPGGFALFDSPFKIPGYKPDYRRMRFSLASTLLGDGYYSYEANTATHGAGGLVWFDEYDNAGRGRGYLGFPSEACSRLENGAYLRRFDHGLVLVNPQSFEVTVRLDKKYKKIKGKQVKAINDGSITDTVVLPPFDGLILLETP